MTALTALPGACTGRYVPGERTVIVSHDDGGNERHQLSLLAADAAPRPAPRAWTTWCRWSATPATSTCWPTSAPGRVCYFTNRRNGVAFDPVIRDLATGAERTAEPGRAHRSPRRRCRPTAGGWRWPCPRP